MSARSRALHIQQELIEAGAEVELVATLDVCLGQPWEHDAGVTFPHASYALKISTPAHPEPEDHVYIIIGDDLHVDFFGCDGHTWERFKHLPYPDAPIFQGKVMPFNGGADFDVALALLKRGWLNAWKTSTE